MSCNVCGQCAEFLASQYGQRTCTKVQNDQWIAEVADFAMNLLDRAKLKTSFLRQVLLILSSLQSSLPLKDAFLEKLWNSQQFIRSPGSLIEAILLETSKNQFEEDVCQAFCIAQLRHSLRCAIATDQFQRPDQWQHWMVLADRSNNSKCIELVLRHALSSACGSSSARRTMGAEQQDIPRAEAEWNLQSESEDEELGLVQVPLILQHLGFWQKLVEIANSRTQPDPDQILRPLNAALKTLAGKIVLEALTVDEISGSGSLVAWESPIFIELLSQEKPAAELRPKLQRMIEKIRFIKHFAEAISHKLPALFPGEARAKHLGKSMHRAFLAASNIPLNPVGAPLSIEMGEVNDQSWTEEFTQDKTWWDNEFQLSLADVPSPSFSMIEKVIRTLHVAKSDRQNPLRSLFQEVDVKMARGEYQMKVLDTIFFMHKEIVGNLQQLSELGEEAGLRPQILRAIEKYWNGVAPHVVPEILQNIRGITASFFRLNFPRIQDRLITILKGRQAADFWHLCRKIQISLCAVLPNKAIASGFSEGAQLDVASLDAMLHVFQASSQENAVGLKTEDLDSISNATQRTSQLFDFLGPEGFDMVSRLVASMADVPGLSFLRVLLSSAQKGEHLATRLAELVEGALTQDTLDSVEQASALFMPLVVAVLSAMDVKVDGGKFQQMAGHVWCWEIQRLALEARSQADIGHLMLKLLAGALQQAGHKLPERIECLRSALRQGQVVQQKLEETSDDATAVSNTVHGMVSSGHLQLSLSDDAMSFEIAGVFNFNKGQERITRDMQQLQECSDKASLAVPKGKVDLDNLTALTPEKVQVFTGCVEGIIGLRQEMTELLQIGHPYLEGKRTFTFPEEAEGLSDGTLQNLKEWLHWAEEAKKQWCKALDEARAKHAIMSCIPARNITRIAHAVLNNQPGLVPPLLSVAVKSPGCFVPDPLLADAFRQCHFFRPRAGSHEDFLDRIVDLLAAQVVPEEALSTFPPLHEFARKYPKSRVPEDSTLKSRMERRTDPKFYPRRILLIQEEESHETGSPSIQSTAVATVLSVLLPLGIAPHPENCLCCDSNTKKDDVLRFLHRVTHATRSACLAGRQAQVLGLFVHVDCLQLDVLQVLWSKVQAMQAAVGKRKEVADDEPEIEVRLVFTLTRGAPKPLVESLEKDLCKQQQIKILKLESIRHFLDQAQKCLGAHQVVRSDYAGDGKTYAIHKAAGWDEASHASIVWGGAQTRGQAARALKGARTARCVHLELHGFEEGGGVDADSLLFELLLFRSVFDPDNSQYMRLSLDTPIFLEVANSIKIKHGDVGTQLMLLSAPVLGCMPGQLKIDSNRSFVFCPADLNPGTASVSARSFGVAGSALLLGPERKRLVGSQDEHDAVFHLLADSASTVVASRHADILHFHCNDVSHAAQLALQEAWRKSHPDADRNEAPVPTKATIMSFLSFLAHWTAKWVHHTFHFEQTFQEVGGVDIHGTFLPVLKEMIGMAAAMCLRSSAAEAQDQQRQLSSAEVEEAESFSLSEAMACRVLDGRAAASTVWAFNTGGSLRFIGNRGELSAGLKHLWKTLQRTGQRIEEPPMDLGQASQESLRKLLLDVMSGHGLKPED